MPINFFLLVERDEGEILGIFRHISEGTSYGIQVVCPNGGILSCPAESIMQFLLSSNEGLVGLIIESDIPEDGSSDEGTDLLHTGIDGDGCSWGGEFDLGEFCSSQV